MNIKPFHLLPEMLSYARPHGSGVEQLFCDRYIATIPNVQQDDFGNYFVEVGSSPNTLFSAHTDTVDYTEGFKKILLDPIVNELFTDNGDCLGADDTTGVWIMKLMIEKGIAGMYVFHRGEEVGCLGSGWMADNKPDWLKLYDHAIAFDRAGDRDIITTQNGSTCASPEFAADLSLRLHDTGHIIGDRFTAARGVYTDTAEYTHLIGECTNISVGYEMQHSPDETQSVDTLKELVPALMMMDWDGITKQRNPEAKPTYSFANNYGRFSSADKDEYDYNNNSPTTGSPTRGDGGDMPRWDELRDFCKDYPEEAADILFDQGITIDEMIYSMDQQKRNDDAEQAWTDDVEKDIEAADADTKEYWDQYYGYEGLASAND
jgi:hypothetical protein